MTLRVGVVNYDISAAYPVNDTLFISILEEIEYGNMTLFEVKQYTNKKIMIEDVRAGKLDGGFVIPKDLGKNLILGQSNICVYVGARDIYSAQINEAILRVY